jgi:hypothetical protein
VANEFRIPTERAADEIAGGEAAKENSEDDRSRGMFAAQNARQILLPDDLINEAGCTRQKTKR